MTTLNAEDKALSHAEDLASEVERLTARIAILREALNDAQTIGDIETIHRIAGIALEKDK